MNYSQTTNIKSWAEEDRPREKLILKGKSTLSNAELIAILIGSGSSNESAVELSKRILASADNNLQALSKYDLEELKEFKGIGEAKAISILAALELGRRYRTTEALARKRISSSRDAYEAIYSYLADAHYEEFYIILLNRANDILSIHRISEGGTSGTVVDPKKVFKLALSKNASGFILCHNHPSGNMQPSHQDKQLTQKIKKSAELLEIALLDHIIVGNNRYYSFADEVIL
jgi:DNA repair protein RadC